MRDDPRVARGEGSRYLAEGRLTGTHVAGVVDRSPLRQALDTVIAARLVGYLATADPGQKS